MITTDTGAKKIENSDNWRLIFDAHNDSVDAEDKIVPEMAPIVNGNKSTVGAAIGEYVLVRNSSITGITDGAYTAAKAIPANTTIDSTYLTAVGTGGALNALNSKIETKTQITFTSLQSGWTIRENNSYQIGNVVYIDVNMLRSTGGAFQQLMDLSDWSAKYCPAYSRYIPATDNTNDKPVSCLINSAGRFNVYGVATSCTSLVINGCFVVK